jgi:hypothetical protein
MLDRADAVASYGLVAAGLAHTALTSRFRPEGGEDALWFAGAGLALVMDGLLNLARQAAPESRIRRLSIAGNFAALPYVLVVAAMLPTPHVMTILGMQGVVTVRSLQKPAARA